MLASDSPVRSLRWRIVAVAGLLFLSGIGLVSFFVLRLLHGDMQKILLDQQLTAANYIARDVDSKLKLRMDSLQRVAHNIPPPLFRDPAALQTWLEDRQAIHTLFPTGLLVIPPDGGPVIADVPHLPSRPKTFTDRDWFIGVTRTRQPFFSKPLVARATQEPAMVMAIPVVAPDDTLLGILAGVTPLTVAGFLDLIRQAGPSPSGSYQLIEPHERVVALASNQQELLRPLPPVGMDPLLDLALAGTRGAGLVDTADGRQELYVIVAIPQTGWLLVGRSPATEAFAPLFDTVRNTVLVTVALSIPILAILLFVLGNLLAPLSRLARELHGMADGSRPMHPLVLPRDDEIAAVADSFNRLQEKLLQQEHRLSDMALSDPLTGLPNRLAISDRLESDLRRIARTGGGLALLFLDLDGFKPVNDQYGHPVGDQVLALVAARLHDCVREVDMVARLGGDEFLILLCDTDAAAEAAGRVARECILALHRPFDINGKVLRIGVSIGIAIADAEAATELSADALVSQADVAMYRAKAAGGGSYAIANAAPVTVTFSFS